MIAKRKTIAQNPPLFLALGFLVTILIGTLLLAQPIASADGSSTSIVNALFTATSATCVTGLVVYNTAQHWSTFGHAVILLLIQIGGLGFMAMTILIAMVLHRKITLSDRLIIREQFGQSSLTGMVRWIRYVVVFTLLAELIGAVLLATQMVPMYGWARGVWYSVFHAVSAFCNAGFDLTGSNLEVFHLNPTVLLTVSALVIVGGLGFGVYLDLFTKKRQKHKSLHTKLVLVITGILLLFGTLLFFVMEDGNPNTMAHMPLWGKWLNAFFQSVTTRTAGFNALPQQSMYEVSGVLTIFLMFVGGSPGGTAGGIKTTTLGVLLLAMRSQIRGEPTIHAFNRSISSDVVMRSLTIIMLSMSWILFVSFFIALRENTVYTRALYETVSAFGTVGLSLDFTGQLSVSSKLLLTITMFLGRLGPVTIAYAIIRKRKPSDVVNAYGNVMVG